jgi:hypothetical protein
VNITYLLMMEAGNEIFEKGRKKACSVKGLSHLIYCGYKLR